MLLAGLDIETTGLDMNAGHRLIQIGIHVWDTETHEVRIFGSDVRPVGKVVYSDYAMQVNGFTKKRIKEAPSQTQVDTMLWGEMLKHYKHDTLIPVGFNVILFDMPFIKRELPLIANMFTYPSPERSTRAIDLMSLGLLYSLKTGVPYEAVKARAMKHVESVMEYAKHHDAIYDAEAAIITLKYFRDTFGEL